MKRGHRNKRGTEMTPTQLERAARWTSEDFEQAARPRAPSTEEKPRAGARAGEFPPPTKRGGKVPQGHERQSLERVELVMTDSGEVKTVMVRKPTEGQCSFIDGLRLTLGVETWHRTGKGTLLTDGQMILECSLVMERIFGFGITRGLGRGRDFYDACWVLGEDLGYVCMGGKSQMGTMLIVVHGTGAAAAAEGWEGRLYRFLKETASRPSITRVDLAHDCFDGSYWSCDYADRAYDCGWWACGGRMPSHEYRGNWKRPDGTGRTLYIGKRKNGKLCRTYEKGKQLGDAESDWVRCEVEIHNNDRVVPLDVLVDPSGYFLAQYPALCVIEPEKIGSRIPTVRRSVQITVAKCIDNLKVSYGAYIRVLRQAMGDTAFLDAVQRQEDVWPVRLLCPADRRGTPIHSAPTVNAVVESELFGVFAEE